VALQEFEGTIALVTHDQDLIEEVGTRVWHFEHGEIRDFKGPYEEYAATSPPSRRRPSTFSAQ
jgi:ATPase subunit of ABC transporter with duplicated ATPase domains